ncbi:DUF4974 domain-containing protein [Bernardetia sp.]|uniref:DUF4974 domain-containing protein n=1 Tax=Bernardetia sp. TaxID=1937974 RepID=UPI0025C500F2|nr:DUF4974 domain-containing protein [Bernardetia sp.]
MKNQILFILAFLCLYFGTQNNILAQNNSRILEQSVTLTVQNKTLENILTDISKKYNVRFSYSNSRLPLQKRISTTVSNLPLKDALTQIFEAASDKYTHIQFRLINGQIVIQAQSSLAETDKQEEKPQIASLPKEPLVIDKKDKNQATVSTKKSEIEKNEVELVEKNNILDSLENSKIDSLKNIIENTVLDSTQIVQNDSTQNTDENIESEMDKKLNAIPMQISLFYPIGTNGARSPQKNNRLSLNLFAGYNGSVTGFEAGGFLNILRKNMKGFQAAGFMNIVGGKTTGFQASGFANITKDSVFAFQGAGFANINGSHTTGFQGAGFLNVVNGNFVGFQAAGFVNAVNGNFKGFQSAGFANVVSKNVEGAQVSGVNVAKNVKGIQIGVINKADTVKGSQIGLINIADSVTGVPIGLINFIKDGYRSFDISTSEGFHTAFAYNIGVNKFYQILSVGIQIDDEARWGLGAGLGTRFPITKNQKLHAGFELMAYHLNEGKRWTNNLNLLNQLKFKVHYQLSKQVGIFIAPTLNVTVSKIYNADTNTYGTNFAPYVFVEDTTTTNRNFSTSTVNTKVWGGGFIGISF